LRGLVPVSSCYGALLWTRLPVLIVSMARIPGAGCGESGCPGATVGPLESLSLGHSAVDRGHVLQSFLDGGDRGGALACAVPVMCALRSPPPGGRQLQRCLTPLVASVKWLLDWPVCAWPVQARTEGASWCCHMCTLSHAETQSHWQVNVGDCRRTRSKGL
jgi:hypothetical protein